MDSPALFRRFPDLAVRIPWIRLAAPRTPVEALPFPEREGDSRLWVKRDDLSSPAYGGNKVRKLEFLLAKAREEGARHVVTAGARGSHHVLATALFGARLGLPTTGVLFPQPETEHAREAAEVNRTLLHEVRSVPWMVAIPPAVRLARLTCPCSSGEVAVIPPGGSDAVGTLGYVSGALELVEQLESGELPEPGEVVVAGGSLGTAAGLALGFELAGLGCRVVAVRVASRLVANRRTLRRLLRETTDLLAEHGVEVPEPARVMDRVDLVHDRIGRGYGHPTEEGIRAHRTFRGFGLVLDPTYTAKAAAELLDRARSDPDTSRLFWHTLSRVPPSRVGLPGKRGSG